MKQIEETVREVRRAIKHARGVYVRGEADILFRVSKREALRTIRPRMHVGHLTVLRWGENLFIG